MGFGNDTVILNNATAVPVEGVVAGARWRLTLIEAYVLLTAITLSFLAVFGSIRRRYNNGLLRFLVRSAYNFSACSVSYTIGQMQSASFRNELFAIWAVFFLIVLGSCDSITAYSLEDNENLSRYNLQLFFQSFWVGWLIGTYDHETKFRTPLFIFWALSVVRTNERAQAMSWAGRSCGLAKSTKLIADYMECEHDLLGQDDFDPTCMKGYNYLVRVGEAEEQAKVSAPHYKNRLAIEDSEIVTTRKIWQCKGRLLSSSGSGGDRLKDLCLSFAMFRLIFRRFTGYPFSEASHEKTWKFVRYGLLSEEGDSEKSLQANTLHHYQSPNGYLNLITVSGRNVDVLVTGIMMVALLFVEILQASFLLVSDWSKLMWVCKYVQKPTWQTNKFIERMIKFISHEWFITPKPWERKLGQYSLIESLDQNSFEKVYNYITTYFTDRRGIKSSRIELAIEVKKAVANSLRINGQQLRNEIASLERNGIQDKLSWACKLETQTHVVLVWHIATSLCEIVSAEQADRPSETVNFSVATSLSKYCAYLAVFAPRFLPDHAYTTKVIFDHVLVEAKEVLTGCKSVKNMHEKLMALGEGDLGETMMQKGARLRWLLIVEVEDKELRWKILADFWAELMLFIAPSDDVAAHAEYLGRGGEFVTQLWALLSHAGILRRDSVFRDV